MQKLCGQSTGPAMARLARNTKSYRMLLFGLLLGASALNLLVFYNLKSAEECAAPPFFHDYPLQAYSTQSAPITDKFTLIINTFHRLELALRTVKHYSSCEAVYAIRVIWCEDQPPPENMDGIDGVRPILRYDVVRNCSLNSRFLPFPGIQTAAIFSVDDDIHIPCMDLNKAFKYWQDNDRNIVGFYPRLHQERRGCRYRYLRTFESLVANRAYSIVLTKAAFFHRDYLSHYSNGIPESVRRFVEEGRNCEDVAMQFAITIATGLPPKAILSSRKRDFGSGWKKQVAGISAAADHDERRSLCLDKFVELFGRGMPLMTRYVKEDEEGFWLTFYAMFAFIFE